MGGKQIVGEKLKTTLMIGGAGGAGCIAVVMMIALVLVTMFAGSLLAALIVWGAWAVIAVPMFGAPALGYWQAFLGFMALSVLASLLHGIFSRRA